MRGLFRREPGFEIADLVFWSSETATSTENVYVLGQDADMTGAVFTLNNSGVLQHRAPLTMNGAALADQLSGLSVNGAGELVAFRWSSTLEYVRIDPKTGVTNVIGTVGDLQAWIGIAVANATTNEVYVIGNNGTEDKIYVMDAISGVVSDAHRIEAAPAGVVLVY